MYQFRTIVVVRTATLNSASGTSKTTTYDMNSVCSHHADIRLPQIVLNPSFLAAFVGTGFVTLVGLLFVGTFAGGIIHNWTVANIPKNERIKLDNWRTQNQGRVTYEQLNAAEDQYRVIERNYSYFHIWKCVLLSPWFQLPVLLFTSLSVWSFALQRGEQYAMLQIAYRTRGLSKGKVKLEVVKEVEWPLFLVGLSKPSDFPGLL
jgi:hypothetical protein